jgi:hypothetical protein
MSTRKRKQDEELVALPSDESEEEEEYVSHPFPSPYHHGASGWLQLASLQLPKMSLRFGAQRWC